YHPDREVLSCSAYSLGVLSAPVVEKWGSIGEAAIVAIPHLLHLLDDPIADVRATAVGALGQIASVPCLLEPVFDAAPKIIALLDDPNYIVRSSAVSAVRSSRSHAQSVLLKLIQLLYDPEWSVRMSSVHTIETLGNLAADAVPHLIPLLEDNEHFLIRFDAATVLIKMGESGKVAIPFVKAALEASLLGNDFSRTKAAILLSQMGEEEIELAIPHLISLLSTPVFFRTWAVNALGNLGERARIAIPDLMLLLDHEDEYLRDAANSALSKVWYQS
ncbi:HEAT repeat domain-containing protein, partial [Nostoc sp. CHAB 5715]|uniref:HEAT repeat domain-containing protein n=1 Tax=Nostoc sp. CHAB 5715 TaxID=2780400 RepID=UPI001E53D809